VFSVRTNKALAVICPADLFRNQRCYHGREAESRGLVELHGDPGSKARRYDENPSMRIPRFKFVDASNDPDIGRLQGGDAGRSIRADDEELALHVIPDQRQDLANEVENSILVGRGRIEDRANEQKIGPLVERSRGWAHVHMVPDDLDAHGAH